MTRALARFLSTTKFEDLPDAVSAETRRAVLDWLGACIAGSSEPPARAMQKIVARFGSSREATVFGAGRTSAAGAALANGVSSHVLELDDVHRGATLHAAAPVIPAALAAAEREHSDGREFLAAIALGYEGALRIGEAVNPSHYRFWHPTGTAATFGAAAAAGSILKLDPQQMTDALGSAGTQAAGLWEFNADGSMSKPLHPAKAAFNGLLAADLAREGFTGASRILEGARGFFRAMSESHDPTHLTDGLGRHWKILENCYKLHACCGHTHTAIDAAIEIRECSGRTACEIASVQVETYGPGLAIVEEPNPSTPTKARFSLAYTVAAALAEGRCGLEQFDASRFSPDGVRDPVAASLLKKIRVAAVDDLTNRYPASWPVRLAVTYCDGGTERREVDFPRGSPENPVSTAELEAKFISVVEPRCGAGLARRALNAARSVESCRDMATLFPDLS
ncbi:MAG TPA: MmgE/PrpD family protein [Bryobacteraceae bacterium]|nr:MmgE/PrpD family protein [Bryobacteraceae bacterium]